MPLMARYDPFSSSPATKHSLPAIDRLFHNSTPDYGTSRNQVRPVGTASPAGSPFEDQIRALQHTQNALLEDILVDYKERAAEQRLDIDRYIRLNRHLQSELDRASRGNRDTERALKENTYISLLINANDLIFTKAALQNDAAEAVRSLHDELQNWILQQPSLQDSQIALHTKLFLDLDTTTHKLVEAGWVESPSQFAAFARNANDTQYSTFEIIDTRNAQAKIVAHYRQELRNLHCHKVFIGAISRRSELIFDTLSSETQSVLRSRVAILQADRVESNLGCEQLDLSDLFSVIPDVAVSAPLTKVLSKSVYAPSPPPMIQGESHGSVQTTPTASQPTTPALSWAATAAHTYVPQPLAPKLGAPVVPTNVVPLRNKASSIKPTEVHRNKNGQRVDQMDENIPYQELQRIKKMKLCNVFFLQGPSFCKGSCGHSHEYPLKSHEKAVLREVARMTPCYYKLDCKEPDCIYGHRCPQSRPDKKDCYYKDDCRFKGWGHGIDLKVVKTTNIRG